MSDDAAPALVAGAALGVSHRLYSGVWPLEQYVTSRPIASTRASRDWNRTLPKRPTVRLEPGHEPARMRGFWSGALGWSGLLVVAACGQVDSHKHSQEMPPPAAGGGGSGQSGAASAGAPGGSGGTDASSGASGSASAVAGAGGSSDAFGGAGGAGGASGAGGAPDDLLDDPSQLELPPLVGPHPYRAIQIATGRYHSCALLEDHRVKCWGYNDYGQLGQGDSMFRGLEPAFMGDALRTIELGTGRRARSIAAGRYTTCAILDDRSAKCWGYGILRKTPGSVIGDALGEMGDGLDPVDLGDHHAKAVALGHYEGCVARDDGSYLCGGTSAQFAEVSAATDAQLVSMSADNSVIGLFDDGSARSIAAEAPTGPVVQFGAIGDRVKLVAGARDKACAYFESQALTCVGVLGLPQDLPAVSSIAITEFGILCGALSPSGAVHCWGTGAVAPWFENTAVGEVDVKLPAPVAQLSSGTFEHHCALLVDGRVACWSWMGQATEGVGWNEVGATEIRTVDLGTFPGP